MSQATALRSTFKLPPNYYDYIAYGGMHVACLGAFWTGVTAADLWLCAISYLRIFGISGIYHRYFAHHAYKTSRPMQFLLALFGSLAVQKGVLWWVDTHRHHHRFPDTPEDIHSPIHRSFLYSHSGWFIDHENRDADLTKVPDLTKYPELVWLNNWNLLPVAVMAAGLFAAFGASGLVWGFFIPTVLIWHATHSVGSFGHKWGGFRRFPTPDYSRNNPIIAFFTLGEGWHNNHHYYPPSARNGFVWWEFDVTYYVLKAMSWLGLIWDLKTPPEHALQGGAPPFREYRRVFQRDLIKFRRRVDSWADGVRDAEPRVDGERGEWFERFKQAFCDRIDAFDDATIELLIDGPPAFRRGFDELTRDLETIAGEWLGDALDGERRAALRQTFAFDFRSLVPQPAAALAAS